MTIALVAHTTVAGIGTAGTNTTSAIDTTGASLLVVAVTYYAASGAVPTISDSKGNTWAPLTAYSGGSSSITTLYYAANPIVGTGHTFSATSSAANFSPVAVLAFSGAATVSPFDVENGNGSSSATSISTGSITPTGDGEVIVNAFGYGISDSPTVDSGLTLVDNTDYTGGVTFGQSTAYLVQSTAAAINPTWTRATASGDSTGIAAFKAAAVAAVPPRDVSHAPQWQPLIAQ